MTSQPARTIFITGASSGLGRAAAKLFASRGWGVIATMRTPDKEQDLARVKNIVLLPLDITDAEQVLRTAAEAIALGDVDVVFNNAGYGMSGPLEGVTDEQMLRMVNTNLMGPIRVTKAFMSHFRTKRAGLFINTTSIDRLWCFGTYNHAPFGEPTLFVVLRYPDRPATARWLAHAFGFEPALTSSASGRSAECTELRLGDSALWLTSAPPEDPLWGKDWHATHILVPDLDAHYDRAQKSGATIVQSPADTADGARVYWARDAEAYLWSFGTQKPGSSR